MERDWGAWGMVRYPNGMSQGQPDAIEVGSNQRLLSASRCRARSVRARIRHVVTHIERLGLQFAPEAPEKLCRVCLLGDEPSAANLRDREVRQCSSHDVRQSPLGILEFAACAATLRNVPLGMGHRAVPGTHANTDGISRLAARVGDHAPNPVRREVFTDRFVEFAADEVRLHAPKPEPGCCASLRGAGSGRPTFACASGERRSEGTCRVPRSPADTRASRGPLHRADPRWKRAGHSCGAL